MKNLLFLVLTALLSISCSSVLDQKYSEDQDQEVMKEIRTTINGEEMGYLMTAVMRLSMSDEDDPSNYTYRELIDMGEEFRVEMDLTVEREKIEAEKAKQEELERIERFRSMVSVELLQKGFTELSYRDYITLKFLILNTSDKNIRAVKGSVVFKDLFGEQIKEVGFTYDDPIPANKQVTYNASLKHNKFIDEDQRLKDKDLDDLKLEWIPESIILEDGTILK